jgi:hypothetical protein
LKLSLSFYFKTRPNAINRQSKVTKTQERQTIEARDGEPLLIEMKNEIPFIKGYAATATSRLFLSLTPRIVREQKKDAPPQ